MGDNWEGVDGALEHRTLGERAWCLDDRTYCYPTAFCPCCFQASSDWKPCPTCGGVGFDAAIGDTEAIAKCQRRSCLHPIDHHTHSKNRCLQCGCPSAIEGGYVDAAIGDTE